MTDVVTNPETWNYYHPVNSTEYHPSNIIRLRMPKANYVCDLSRAFIRLRTRIRADVEGRASSGDEPLPAGSVLVPKMDTSNSQISVPAVTNAGTIFDIVDCQINGQALYHDDFHQSSCRLNSFNKSDEWLGSYPQTFLNMDDSMTDEKHSQMAYRETILEQEIPLVDITASEQEYKGETWISKELIIPLPVLFPMFETVNEWPSFLVNDTLEFNLYVSRLVKYWVILRYIDTGMYIPGNQPYLIPIESYNGYHEDTHTLTATYTKSGSGLLGGPDINLTYDLESFYVDNIVLHVPVHTPSTNEVANMTNLIQNATGFTYSFKHWKTLTYLSRYISADENELQFTQQVNFNPSVNNMFGVAMTALKPNTEVFFEKPQINTIQLNLGSWELAGNGTHLYDNYTYGGDMLRNILDNFGQSHLKYYQTIPKFVIRDQAETLNQASSATAHRTAGSYFAYYDASPYDEMGVGANEFSNLITYKYSVTNPIYANQGLQNAKTYCSIQTLSVLNINSAGVVCFNPDSKDFTAESLVNLFNANSTYAFRGPHGIPPQLIPIIAQALPQVLGALPNVFGSLKEGIHKLFGHGLVAKRSMRHMDWLRRHLTDEEYRTNYNNLLSDSYRMKRKHWRGTFRDIIANRSHGIAMDFIKKHEIVDRTLPILKPGQRVNNFFRNRFRMIPFSRFLHIPKGAHPMATHGLFSGIKKAWNWVKGKAKRAAHKVKGVLIGAADTALDMASNIFSAFASGKISKTEALDSAKELLVNTGQDIRQQILDMALNNSHGQAMLMRHGALDKKRMVYSIYRQTPYMNIKKFIKEGVNHGLAMPYKMGTRVCA